MEEGATPPPPKRRAEEQVNENKPTRVTTETKVLIEIQQSIKALNEWMNNSSRAISTLTERVENIAKITQQQNECLQQRLLAVEALTPRPPPNGLEPMASYRSFGYAEGETTALTTLVRRNLTVKQYDTKITSIDNILIELVPQRKRHESLFILNIYSNPKHKKHRFLTLFKRALNIAERNPIIIGGDFNAPHTAWGYSYVFPKGRNLWFDSQQEGLTLITNPSTPTRAGTSSTKDSTPDLTFTRNTSATTWQNTFEDLGSDHYIIAIRVQGGPRKQTGRQLKMVDWTRFRKSRENQVQPIDDIERWTHTLKQDVNNATQTAPPEAHLEQIDSRLLHMKRFAVSAGEPVRPPTVSDLRERPKYNSLRVETKSDVPDVKPELLSQSDLVVVLTLRIVPLSVNVFEPHWQACLFVSQRCR
ncbi:hypothetical protein HPB50_023141 [Hyalomma asiaticum]|uniref:Uncharacterized protein n=1 Tax=Hyalomma asiaticum TaxID=266040 RepID=A0ACB7T8L9_HYAAI|nr:hypothetical protein HPB50_023141 [Hyalomma asiaticum]